MPSLGYNSNYEQGPISAPARSAASIVAILCAVGSFYLSAHHHQLWGFITAFIAIGAGIIGGIRALSPRVSGGILSIIAVLLGAIAVIVAIIALIL